VSRRRILFLSGAPGVGGGERAVMPSLAASTVIELVVAGPAPVAQYARELGAEAVVLDVPRAHKLTHGARIASGALRVRRLFRELGATLLYANGTRAIPYALPAALLGCRPLLFHHHGLLTAGPVRALTFGVDRFADAVITPSRASAEPFRASAMVSVIPYGIDVRRFSPRPSPRVAGESVVGSLTRPDPTKGMDDFVQLARRVNAGGRSVHFVLGGGPAFPHEHEPFMRVSADAADAGVRVTGHIDETPAFYRGLDVFVHLGGPEGFGLVVLEALACGVPVVAYDWGAIPDAFAGLVTVVPPRDVDAAAAAVEALLDDSDRRLHEGRRGRDAAEQRFTVARMAAEIETVVASLPARQ
jgi:glycosyltransferase involved in cell wall biosynthesis